MKWTKIINGWRKDEGKDEDSNMGNGLSIGHQGKDIY